jgi:uncharacterized membrane protein
MFTDITGFTTLMGQNENKALEILETNRKIQKRLIKKYHGIWLKEVGDGILCCFSSVVNAIYCGSAIQKEISEIQDLELKVAIHTGEVVFNNGDVFGDGVNIASRIEEISETGKICVSGAVYENVKNIEGLKITSLGERKFKNVEQTITLHEVEVLEESKIHSPKPSLSFQNLSKGKAFLDIEAPVEEDYDDLKYKATVSGVYGYAWDRALQNIVPLLLITLLIAVIESGTWAVSEDGYQNLDVISVIVWLFLLTPLEYGASYIYLRAARRQKVVLKDVQVGFYHYLNVIFSRLLVLFLVGLGIVLLIVPGIIVACRLAFVDYLVVDKGLDPVQAVQESWKMTKGYGWRIFGMALLALPIALLGLIAFGVGIIFSVMWISMAFAVLYVKVADTYEFKTNE